MTKVTETNERLVSEVAERDAIIYVIKEENILLRVKREKGDMNMKKNLKKKSIIRTPVSLKIK